MVGQLTTPAALVQVYPVDECTGGADIDIDIIAIHGLDTRSPDTWIWRDPVNPKIRINWLQDPKMLPSIVGRARIFTCDWPADMLQKSVSTTLKESAQCLLDIIRKHLEQNKHVGIDRPVLFIASCLGGTILIKALEMDLQDDDERDCFSLKAVTRGIIFLATPFRGTAFKEMPDITLRTWALFKDQTVSTLIDYTRKPTPDLDELVRKFDDLRRKRIYYVFTFWEAHETNLLGKIHLAWMFSKRAFLGCYAVVFVSVVLASPWLLVLCLLWALAFPVCKPRQLVDENSGTAQLFDNQRLNRSHVLMNKFHGPDCEDYKKVAEKIKEIVRNIREGTPLEKAYAWICNNYYTDERLKIERLSGDPLPLDQCYINLAIVEQSGHGGSRLKKGDAEASPFSLFARQKVETPDKTSQVELATIFNRRKGNRREGDGVIEPRRILLRGRAGVGKTTLCKKIVHEFTQGTWIEWSKLFDRILWVPLRNLKLEERRRQAGYNFASLFVDEYFALLNNRSDLAKELCRALGTKTLFLLDGLDEVSQDLASDSSMSRFLIELLKQPNVIITSRPSVKAPPDLDLELETIGFYPNQVEAYIEGAFTNLDTGKVDSKNIQQVRSFIESHWLIQGLVRIPIQLDALCYTWIDLAEGPVPDTMTRMYEAIEQKLWKKDVIRLEKKQEGGPVTAAQIATETVEKLVPDEICFLQGLAFMGLYNDMIDFTAQHRKVISKHFGSTLLLDKTLPRLSFLRTSDPFAKIEDRGYHFIHLTFQEYFAARYFVQQWNDKKFLQCWNIARKSIIEIEPASFFREHKYTARYDILWRFVGGMLDAGGKAALFMDMIEAEPLDLLGPTHQRLVMHCLSEVTGDISTKTAIYQRLSKWLLFECEFHRTALLAREAEFPQCALENALCEGSEDIKTTILLSITSRAAISGSIIKLIASWLDHPSPSLRSAAAGVLRARSDLPEEIQQELKARLEGEDKDVRMAALETLGGQSDLPELVLHAVVARLEDEDEHVRQTAVSVLCDRSNLPEKILQEVEAKLGDKNVRWPAIRVLRGRSDLSEKILQAVVARLEDEDKDIRRAAVRVLGGRSDLPEETLQTVAARLEDEDEEVRQTAVRVLGGRSNLPEVILQAVAEQLRDKVEGARKTALETLCGRPDLPEVILQAVAERLGDKGEGIRKTALETLGGRSDLPEEVLQAVEVRLGDEDHSIRWNAVKVLRGQSVLSEKILQDVAAGLGDEGESIRRNAVEVLGGRSDLPEKILQVVAARLEDESSSVRRHAIDVLGGRSDLPEEILRTVAARLEDESSSVRRHAVNVLGRRPDLPEEYVQAVAARLSDEDHLVRWSAVKFLGDRSDLPEEILRAVARRLKDGNENVRSKAIQALSGRSDLPEILHAVAARLVDEHENVRSRAVRALSGRSDLPEEILQAVAARLEDNDEALRVAAEALLRKDGKLYRTLLNGPYAPALCKIALGQSFEEQLAWYINKDGHFYVNSPEHISAFSADNQANDVRAVINKAQPRNFPSIGL